MHLPGLNTSIAPFGVSAREFRIAREIVQQVGSEFDLFSPDLDRWDGSKLDKDLLPRSIRVTGKDLKSQGYSEYASVVVKADEEGKVVRFEVKKTDGTLASLDWAQRDGWVHPRLSIRSESMDSSIVVDGSHGGYKIFQQKPRTMPV